MPAEWRIWYTDGATFSSNDGLPGEAPNVGVQAIAERRDGRTILWIYGELYCWVGDGWRCAPGRKKSWPAGARVLAGELIGLEVFKAIKSEAIEWLHAERAC